MDPVKISSLELENVKRIRAVEIVPTQDGLTVIGGRNGQGKTSVLDAIAWALGGNKMKPVNPTRDGASTPAKLHIELSNGIVVERKGKNGALHVTDQTGMKGTQKLLDEFLSALALDLPKFLSGTDKERTTALLQTLGIDQELARLDGQIKNTFTERTAVGNEARRLRAHADKLPFHDDAPMEPVSVAALIHEQQEILSRNAENNVIRQNVRQLEMEAEGLTAQIESLKKAVAQYTEAYERVSEKLEAGRKSAEDLHDESTAEIEASIANIEQTNAMVADNQRKAEANAQASSREAEYQHLTDEIERLRSARISLLEGAPLPLDGLSVDADGRMTYQGQVWSDMSGSEKLRVATAIVRATKPECGFVLVDELEKLDPQTLAEFAAWATSEGLQVIGTRVGTDDACTVIIEDGRVEGSEYDGAPAPDPRGEALDWAIPEGPLF